MKLMGSFEKQVSFIFIALTLGNIGNFIFHIFMGRHLPETEYRGLRRPRGRPFCPTRAKLRLPDVCRAVVGGTSIRTLQIGESNEH